MDSSHTGICCCAHCGATTPWRSDFTYEVGQKIWPGFTGRCRVCLVQDWQEVIELTPRLLAVEELTTAACKKG